MKNLLFLLLFCVFWPSQCEDSSFIGWDGKEHQRPVDREKLRHFIGKHEKLHHIQAVKSAPVYARVPNVHHGLHALNHRVVHKTQPETPVAPTVTLGKVSTRYMETHPFGKVHSKNGDLVVPFGKAVPTVAAHAVKAGPGHWTEIRLYRAEMCVKMLKKHGIKFTDNKEKCVNFMEKRCKVKSKTGVCTEWYDLLGKLQDGESMEDIEVDMELEEGSVAMAPAPAAMMSPAAAEDEGGTPPLPAQGYHGETVVHKNGVTHTSDWHEEYGPSGDSDMVKICKQYPDNTWCKYKGYHGKVKALEGPEKKNEKPENPNRLRNILLLVVACAAVGLIVAVKSNP